jgi:1-acyl-sn-glycerol-3-phosphate acyltransferase
LKIVKSILIWTAGAFYFLLIFPVISLLIIAGDPDRVYQIIRKLFKVMLKIVRLRLVVSGYENFDREKNYIIMGNHESLFDIFAVPIAIPMRIIAIEAAGHFKVPLWGYITRKWGNIPIQRKNLQEAKKSLEKARTIIKKKVSLVILPEGGRTVTGEIKEFKKGPFHLALEAETDILPFAMNGLFEFKSKNSWLLNPGDARIVFGKPIPYQSFRDLSVEELRDLVRKRIGELKSAGEV